MQRKSLWGSYKSIPPRSRMFIGLAGMAFAAIGILVSDKIEEQYPVEQRVESVPIVIDRS
ncbi:hypothetical protein INT44_003282 [Umbelopsis vinacea]|uniref:Uncharacterized protein n=1 Tax=Umbelopsis vinacea TaxID=44442 RepID=A0A8H7Q8G0_9FUNG|nr:hypothetical protein INT44_003282 [Umbelopsis vinacea]KAI9288255.1 hypothetical protein BC943DRAFT_318081 [Umbelopsis sp. AD052]